MHNINVLETNKLGLLIAAMTILKVKQYINALLITIYGHKSVWNSLIHTSKEKV
jgi:hypothetical protein